MSTEIDQSGKKSSKGKTVLGIIGVLVVIGIIGNMIDSDKSNTSSTSSSCRLSGCNSTPNGWRYVTSGHGAYSYSCVRTGPNTGYSSHKGSYCTKNHCIQDR